MTSAYWLFGSFQKGDEVMFLDPQGSGEILVKRIYAFGGETVPPVLSPYAGTGREFRTVYRVPDDCVYVLGDNLAESIDSRSYGHIKTSELIGKVVNVPGMAHGTTFWLAVGYTGVLCAALAGAMHHKPS